jgi:hypothetical protein
MILSLACPFFKVIGIKYPFFGESLLFSFKISSNLEMNGFSIK